MNKYDLFERIKKEWPWQKSASCVHYFLHSNKVYQQTEENPHCLLKMHDAQIISDYKGMEV